MYTEYYRCKTSEFINKFSMLTPLSKIINLRYLHQFFFIFTNRRVEEEPSENSAILGGWQGLGSSRMGNDDLLNVDDPETHEIDRDSKHRCPFCYYKSRFKRNILDHQYENKIFSYRPFSYSNHI
ncbi:hypothetical protein Anas_09248 [Armadillidium nasatum]|uniref:Uncharacterized protein n=1 Tax=Armadillidium nasatum TaxID=96803 RepID=A0A5N5TL20_9CRUS|nr:hypothetical protein Anas_09248 [Armadillidium nasatum]